jgi:adenylate cyclase
VRTSPRLRNAFLYAVVMIVAVLGSLVPNSRESPFAAGERRAYDLQMNFLRDFFPQPVDNDVVVIGTDAATEQVFLEPIALWHRHFGRTYAALAVARPAVVAVDFGLPERSFDWLLTEEEKVDKEIMKGLVMLRRTGTRIVFVQHLRDTGEVAPIQENFHSLVPPETLGIDRQLQDPDGVSRRFSDSFLRDEKGEALPTLAGRVLRALGRPVQEGESYIDYSIGDRVRYIPMQDVNRWSEAGDVARLKAAFGGRIVLIGSMGGATDRWPLPVKVIDLLEDGSAAETKLRQPGVMIHAQVLRSHLANGMLVPLPEWVRWILCALAALAVLVHARPWMLVTGALAFPLLVIGASTFAIRHSQQLLPVASIVLCFWIALVVRAAFDAVEATLERIRMQRTFAGQVSPDVMREMLHGDLTPGVSGQLADICVLFSDVRDFTTLSEKMPPEIVTAVLQRYFDRMVRAVHKFNGTVDKFIGDGLMVLFGAPRKSTDACGDAVRCALEMMSELDALNAEFRREGLPTLTIGIGVNYGTVTVGNIGSSERHNYSAIGDAVNVAARVEGLTKDLGRKIVITEAVVSRIDDKFHFDPLGEHQVKGHSPVKVWGIRTARATPAAA